jgi:hypothetical protein
MGFRWTTGHSARGVPYSFIERSVPRIQDAILECVVYLYPSEAAAQDGERFGGSGFLIGVPVLDDRSLVCVVTNKHVIDGGSMVVRVNTHSGKIDTIALDGAHWFEHPDGDDVVVCPIGLNTEHHKIKFLSARMFLDRGTVDWADIGPGDDCFMVGRFISQEGKQQNLPSVRFGNIAQMPWEPIVIGGYAQESFLVEARSIAGYSGSPVFVQIPPNPLPPGPPEIVKQLPDYNPKRPRLPITLGPWLLGIDYCHLFDREKPRSDKDPDDILDMGWHIRANTGMMGVVPAWKLQEILDGPMKPHIEEVKQEAEKQKRSEANATLDAAPPASDKNSKRLSEE